MRPTARLADSIGCPMPVISYVPIRQQWSLLASGLLQTLLFTDLTMPEMHSNNNKNNKSNNNIPLLAL